MMILGEPARLRSPQDAASVSPSGLVLAVGPGDKGMRKSTTDERGLSRKELLL